MFLLRNRSSDGEGVGAQRRTAAHVVCIVGCVLSSQNCRGCGVYRFKLCSLIIAFVSLATLQIYASAQIAHRGAINRISL